MSKRIEELVKQAKNGDSAAFGELYSENSEKLLKYIKSMNVKQADAEDIMSETFMDAMTHIGDLKNDEAFSSWLFTIAKRKVYAQTKDNAKRVDAVISEDSAYSDGVSELADRTAYENEDIYGNTVMLPSDYAENEEIRGLVVETINSLSEEQRTVVYGYYYDGKNSLELADELGISENTVRSRLKYAKQHIEKKLRKLQESGVVLSVVPIGKLLTIAEEGVKKKAAAAGAAAASAASASSEAAAVVSSSKAAAFAAAAVAIVGMIAATSFLGHSLIGDKRTEDSSNDMVVTTAVTTVTTTKARETSLDKGSSTSVVYIKVPENIDLTSKATTIATKASTTEEIKNGTTEEIIAPITTEEEVPELPKEFYDPSEPVMQENEIKIQPIRVYEDNNELVLDTYIINGYDYGVYDISDIEIMLADANNVAFANNSFETLKNNDDSSLTIYAHENIKWTFKYSRDNYDLTNADLSVVTPIFSTSHKKSDKEFHGTANPQPLKNNINIQSVNIYENSDGLVMEAYVINGFNRTVWNVSNVQIQLSDRNGNVFASADFGTLLNSDGSAAVIGANNYVPWTFTFKKDSYDLTNADLSMVNTKSSCGYNY